jgi:hypothetical protein
LGTTESRLELNRIVGCVDLNRVAQDGMRVRASAGAASLRRRPTREEALAQAGARIEALRAEAEGEPTAWDRREKGARRPAARGRAERVEAASERLPGPEAKAKAGERDQARCATTDPEATVMKMADGGSRPAYNFRSSTATDGQVIVGVDVDRTGGDAGQMVPMVEQVEERYEAVPDGALVDGGFARHDRIETVSGPGMGRTVYAPVPKPKDPRVDRHAPEPGDSAAVAAWRERMGTEPAQAISTGRASTAGCVNAPARGRGLLRLLVGGLAKVEAIALWHALAHELLRSARRRAAAAGAT